MRPGGPMGGPMGGPGRRPPSGKREPYGTIKPFPEKPAVDDFTEKDFDLKQMEKESEEMLQMTFLNRDNASFQMNSGGDLTLTYPLDASIASNQKEKNSTYEHIVLIETFPFSTPYSFISVRNPQDKNKELGLIKDLEKDFDATTIKILKEHLDLRYHMPVIQKILQAKESGGYTHFTVMTDFGETQFSLRNNGTFITALTDTRLIIQDLENNRFEIPDKTKLPAKDLKKLDIFM